MVRLINFSGGKTSAYMTIKNYREGDYVVFTDTGREHPKTYKFINDFEAYSLSGRGAFVQFIIAKTGQKYERDEGLVRN